MLIQYWKKSAAESIGFAAYGEEKLSNVVVVGNVLCEACSGTSSYFIPSATVGLECRVDINQKTRSPSSLLVEIAQSDEYGDFLLEVPSAFHLEERIRDCSITLVSNPEGSCNVPSTRKPCNLVLLSSYPNGLRIYTCAVPLSYRPPFCYDGLLEISHT
ncbi:hypothetical protein SUGI_0947300 [Cryptomeria japonica]|nr:hypothetical protein SUGI_0947300 [Cryptomeria japonica]